MIVKAAFADLIHRTIRLEFIRTYWESDTEGYDGAEAMALGYQGA
jgi:hypothetical protein